MAQDCQASDTVLVVEDGSVLPDPPCVLFLGTQANYEIVVCTAKDANALTVQRGQEGTIAKDWPAGTKVENRFTAGTYDTLVSGPESAASRSVPVFADNSGKILEDPGFIYVSEDGKVGIGTPQPAHQLDVAGNAFISGDVYLSSSDKKASSVTTKAMTIWVDADNGSDETGDGSQAKPYKTINRAFADVPEGLAHPVTIKLKPAANKYARGLLRNKVFLSPNALFILEGTMNVIDSGTVSAVLQNVPDPVYGEDVRVDKIIDLTKTWATDAFKYKVLRVYKPGVGEHYRIITNNDANSIYVSYRFFNPIPDSTWNYEILDWGSVIDGLECSNLVGPIRVEGIKFDTATPYPLRIWSVPSAAVRYCALVKQSGALHAFRFQDAFISMSACFLDGTGTDYDGIVPDYGRFAKLEAHGVIIRGFRYGVWYTASGGILVFRDGSRILRDGATNSQYGIRIESPTLVFLYSPFGKVVVDVPNGLYGRFGARFSSDQYVYFPPSVSTPIDVYDGLNYTGDFYISGNVGIGTQNTQGYKLYVNGSLYATSKSADVKTPEGRFAFYSLEGTEHWFVDFGSGQLRRGEAIIKIDRVFRQAISEERPYIVILSPTSECSGLYVAEKARDYFKVKELGGGTSNATFDYLIFGPRRGYEHIRLEKLGRVGEAIAEAGQPFELAPPPTPEEGIDFHTPDHAH